MKQVIVRQNNRFMIDKSFIKDGVNKDEICSALYSEIYLEFRGANTNKKYSKFNNLQRFEIINNFAKDWLKKRGLYNEAT